MSQINKDKQTAAGGLGGFFLCVLVGILLHKVALGIIAGLFFGSAISAALSRRKG